MSRSGSGERATHLRNIAYIGQRISAASRTLRNAVARIQFDVSRDGCDRAYWCAAGFSSFHCPFIDGGINLAEVVNACVGLRGGSGFHEIGDRNCSQQADNGHHNHDFHQCEARPS